MKLDKYEAKLWRAAHRCAIVTIGQRVKEDFSYEATDEQIIDRAARMADMSVICYRERLSPNPIAILLEERRKEIEDLLDECGKLRIDNARLTLRLEVAISKLGQEHKPPEGWEERVTVGRREWYTPNNSALEAIGRPIEHSFTPSPAAPSSCAFCSRAEEDHPK